MKTSKPKESQSHTLDSNPKASRQASITDILQAYKNKYSGTLALQKKADMELAKSEAQKKVDEEKMAAKSDRSTHLKHMVTTSKVNKKSASTVTLNSRNQYINDAKVKAANMAAKPFEKQINNSYTKKLSLEKLKNKTKKPDEKSKIQEEISEIDAKIIQLKSNSQSTGSSGSVIQCVRGIMGDFLYDQNFSELNYMYQNSDAMGSLYVQLAADILNGDLQINGIESDNYEELMTQLSNKNIEEIKNIACQCYGGNCGLITNYFIEKDSYKEGISEDLKGSNNFTKISNCILNNKDVIIRLSLGDNHVFPLFVYEDSVEIIQAWQGKYRVTDWLKKENSLFAKQEFLDSLHRLISLDKKNNADSNRLFNVDSTEITATEVKIEGIQNFIPYVNTDKEPEQ